MGCNRHRVQFRGSGDRPDQFELAISDRIRCHRRRCRVRLARGGDLAEPGPSALSWLSPIGWNQQVRAYAGDRWEVLLLPVAPGVALIPVAAVLRAHRDLGTGLRQDRPGRARGNLAGVWGLAIRLQNRVFLAWAIAVVAFGLLIGSLADSVTDFLASPNAQELIEKLGGAGFLTDAFLAAEIAIMGIVVAVYGVSAANHLRSEETAGHTEVVLATATTRTKWASSHYVVALVGVAVLMVLTGLRWSGRGIRARRQARSVE